MSSMVFAFGVSSPYWKDNPLEMYPGQSETVMLNLQNLADGAEDVVAELELVESSDISSLARTNYNVGAGEQVDASLRVSVPSDAEIGDTYNIEVSVKTVTSGESAGVAFGTGMTTAFQVNVVEKPEMPISTTTIAIIIIAIVAVLVIIWYLLRRRKV